MIDISTFKAYLPITTLKLCFKYSVFFKLFTNEFPSLKTSGLLMKFNQHLIFLHEILITSGVQDRHFFIY
jgi:hypothetical protein